LFAESRGLGQGSGQLPDLGEVQQPIALQVKLVRGLDERFRRREQRLGLVDGSLPGLELPAYAAPVELGRDVVGGGELLADPGELGRLVVATLLLQGLGQET